MIDNSGIGNIKYLLTLMQSSGKDTTFEAGSIIKAQVINITDSGDAVLRIATTSGDKNSPSGTIIKAYSEVPLTKGQNIFLEILEGKDNITMRFIGESGKSPEALQQMIKNPGTGNIKNLLTLTQSSGKDARFEAGSIIKAQVINITDSGDAVLRIATTSGDKNSPSGTIITAYSEVPLTKGQNIFLEILGGKDNITMRFMGYSDSSSETIRQNFPVKILDMLAQLSTARAGNPEFQKLFNMLKSLPESIKTAIPEFKSLEQLLLDIRQLDGKVLKAFVETSGVAFETRLKIAVLGDPASILQNLMSLQAEGDLKALLLRLKGLLKDRHILEALKLSGHDIADVSEKIDKFIKNIELFQLTSKLNDMFYTFLPVLWDGLKDGEFLFKKNREKGKESYTCDINLDLESIGKLSISVTILDKSFFITFYSERHEVNELIKSQKHVLEERFALQGLPLKAINFNHKNAIPFGKSNDQGVDVKI
ncbi:MAG: flagellar hook-length control protein FliK [Nitrospirae bacterium]|nr:flagellar hook-length control protein FliK [Nitrospirota bacterium]